ncbi:WSC domain-containing protein 1 [Hondaea fermentalgiana]|uniref:WSC domain-containing protein 1 n=1 Tax=Hondaea fermentalgiana TaxID=2315210 RepID=A0A2R5GPL5_9STRA|nr:WSC domain-containing protein 1 [Hondaea fermentalgiana]|eukprot:GBG30563.1 WSC domain-containing protein 1 [Hondaea fermentalgiana]
MAAFSKRAEGLPLPVKIALSVCGLLLLILMLNQATSNDATVSKLLGASHANEVPDDSALEVDVNPTDPIDFQENGLPIYPDTPASEKGKFVKGKSVYTREQVDEMNRKIEELAQNVIKRIEAGPPKCMPKICAEKYKFRDTTKTTGLKVGLTSIPGSGNTWMRSVVRAGTRLYTGSVYRDGNLIKNGFVGEKLDVKDPATAVIKSHHGFHYKHPIWKFCDANIHVIRSPFDAFLAECNRHGGGHTGSLDRNVLIKKCTNFASHKIGRIKNMYDVWEKESKGELKTRQGPTVRVHLQEDHAMPIATLFYEDMERDFTRATAYLLSFLQVFMEDEPEWPDAYEGLICALSEGQQQEKIHRHAKEPPPGEIFRTPSGEPNEISQALCKAVEDLWNEDKWGPCNGHYQKDRTDIVKHPRMHDIPENVCEAGESPDPTV